ncbi:hypothetical protein NHL50_09180 [Acidimicrobiia bacterium EGI L10123]|uniref:hypothetical protein n=1 Tax=Salinilacustrithrix flava TaxID=2957203 RepID=UPI003D7C2917|nr:hypothetical protein [Acidimicrobiia bacterium EGI L10123]
MTSPSPAPQGLQYPTRTKVIIAVVLTVAIAAIVLAYVTTAEGDGGDVSVSGADGLQDTGSRDPSGVEALIPPRGSEILGQEAIGIDLVPGWTGELTLLPGNGVATRLTDDEIEVDGLNRIIFQPGPDKSIERLSGDYCLVATIWDQVEGREQTQRVENWCFSAT